MLLTAALLAAPLPAMAGPAAPLSELRAEIAERLDGDLRAFYRARDQRPLWISEDGRLDPAATQLLELIASAQLDGVRAKKLKPDRLAALVRKAQEKPSAETLARAEMALSKTFADYVGAMHQAPRTAMRYVDRELEPVAPTTRAVLEAAAAEASLQKYVSSLGWMHPLYGQLRQVLTSDSLAPAHRTLIQANLERLRAIPGRPAERYVLVDAAGARLWMYENGRIVDSMKVVVGKPDNPTPLMAGFIRHAILNPYWNIPPDLAREKIAANVLQYGLGYLKRGRYQVMSGWTDAAEVVDPATIDWAAVARGERQVRIRQLPGGDNFMGKVKFEFPNDLGIYLHDTPEMNLMREDERQFSSGCVRLEDASRLGRWLLRKPLPRRVSRPEQRVDLPALVPVYITYLTAVPRDGRIAFNPDPYGHDSTSLATVGGRSRSR